MVVPSEKNTEIIDLSMEEVEFKDSALKTLNNTGEKDPTTSEKLVERDKISKVENEDETKSDAEENLPNHIPTDTISSPVISHSSINSETEIKKSESILSLEKNDQAGDLKVLGDADTLTKNRCEEISNDSHGDQLFSTNYSILEPETECIDVKAFDSTLYETIETTNDFLEETGDVFEHIDVEEEGFQSPHNTLGDQVEDLSRTPPRLAPPRSPLLTSTPHSLPPLPRVRASTSPAPSPLPPVSLVDSGPLSLPSLPSSGSKSYDYLLKVLLVGDSDVGKQEILSGLEDGSVDSPYCSSTGAAYKTTTILIDGKRVKLQIWDTSGQGRFCTIIRSYSRGAQGILLVYDITNKWSFEGMDRWVREVEEHAPGIPKVLVGNRLHLAFKRQVDQTEAEAYAERNHMGFYEVSPLVNFNITESFQELSRMALKRNGMERLWRSNKVLSLHELCCHSIVANINSNVYNIDKLPLPDAIKANLKSYAMTNSSGLRQALNYKTLKDRKKKSRPPDANGSKRMNLSRKSCVLS